jgi:hypothetical protein
MPSELYINFFKVWCCYNASLFVDTGTITADSTDTWQAELSVRSGPYWLHGEYLRTDVTNSNYGDL